MKKQMNHSDWTPVKIDNQQPLTLLTAVCQVGDVVRDSEFNPEIFKVAARPIAYIAQLLQLNEQQSVVYAIMMNMYFDRELSVVDIARFLGMSIIKAMMFSEDIEELCRRQYLVANNDSFNTVKTYHTTREAIDSLQHDHIINLRSLKVNTLEEWFVELDRIVHSRCREEIDYDMFCLQVDDLIAMNKELPMVKRYRAKAELIGTDERMLFFWVCNMCVSDGFESIVPDNFKKLFPNSGTYQVQRKTLASGANILIANGLLCATKRGEQRNRDCYELSNWVINELLAELELTNNAVTPNDILAHTDIVPKQLFYNAREQELVDRLAALLQQERYVSVRSELRHLGFRSGFTCLFHGAPGTGKTETVLQLARKSGRDVLQVNISEIKSMWVGESEKNIKAVFTRYRKLVEESEKAPILLFNEADAIIGKRLEDVQRSTDKMENAMQNIILEEIERLDGILIATTNLTCNMDKAFERRFLYKIEFERPSTETKSAIWRSMIADLSNDDAVALATKYDFSGGQIENVARKSVVDKIILGTSLSLDSLCKHCDCELLGKSTNRRRIGF